MVGRPVRVKRCLERLRVTYAVTAQDEVDGGFPVTCSPKSGSLLAVGRTRVKCSASDTSGNTAAATFVVNVVRKR
jgi:HYR domain